MKVISEKLSGTRSFRGLGFVEINGIQYPVCGSRQFECGRKATVRYVDEQIEMLEVLEPTMLAVFPGSLEGFPIATNGRVFVTVDKKYSLYRGLLEGICLGGISDGASTISVVPPLFLNSRYIYGAGRIDQWNPDFPVWDSSFDLAWDFDAVSMRQ